MLWWLPSPVCFCIMNVTVTRKQTSHTQSSQQWDGTGGRGDSNRTRACGRGDIFLNSTQLDSTQQDSRNFRCLVAGRAHRSHRRQTDGYSGACVKRLSFYLLHSHTLTSTLTHTHTRMVLLTSCFAFIGLKCEIANKYQEFLSFLFFLSSFSRVTLATTLPGLLNYLLGFFFIYR